MVAVLPVLLPGRALGEEAPSAIEVTPLPADGSTQRATITTPHYALYLERYDAEDFGKMMEAAYAAWTAFFGKEPKLNAKDGKLRVKGYATADSYVAGGKADNTPTYVSPLGNSGYYWSGTKLAHFFATSGAGFMRYMALHEAMHQFHYIAACDNQGCSSDWLCEGLAVWSGGSEWNGRAVNLGPANFDPLSQTPKTLNEMTRDGPATVAFLATQYPRECQKLLQALNRREKEDVAWKKAFGFTDAPAAFLEEYFNWRKQRTPARFVSWTHHIRQRAVLAALNVAEWRLGTAPEPLVKLRQTILDLVKDPGAGAAHEEAVQAIFTARVLEVISACAKNTAEGAADCTRDLAEVADIFRPKPPPASTPSASAAAKPKPKTTLRPIRAEALREYEVKLRDTLGKELAGGRRPGFDLEALAARIQILSLDARGGMVVSLKDGGKMDLNWSMLSARDKLNLALAMPSVEDAPEHWALAAFYLFASNQPERAENHLLHAGAAGEAVRKEFQSEEVVQGKP